MNRATRLFLLALLATLPAFAAFSQEGTPFVDGRWEGLVDIRSDSEALPEEEVFALRLFSADPETGSPQGGLVDMPSRGLFGFPMEEVGRDARGVSFTLRGKAPMKGRFELEAMGGGSAEGNAPLIGRMRLLSSKTEGEAEVLAEGGFSLSRSKETSRGRAYGTDYPIDTGRGILPGSLILPELEAGGAPPLVLILSGAQADRDGNNYAVPGKSDSLLQLALALRDRGVASLRFDKRGAGMSYALVQDEGKLRFDDHIGDAAAALRVLAADRRFSSLSVVGFAEGALVGSCALESLPDAAFASPVPVVGIVALCASGKNELESVEEALASAPSELADEAGAIMAALKAGSTYPDPSPYFADYFNPSAQAYLASLFARDARASFAAVAKRCAALVVAGGSDLQVKRAESELLASSASGAAYRVLGGMSHALKAVGEDEEANYASFTDPKLPLAEGLAELIAAFAKGESLPGEAPAIADPSLVPAPGSEEAEDSGEGLAR
jgi:hypothetical protein